MKAKSSRGRSHGFNLRTTIAVAVALILISMIFVALAEDYHLLDSPVEQKSGGPGGNKEEENGRYSMHDPIRINGDDDFTSGNGVFGGSGVSGDPYLISGWEINGAGHGYCLYLGNTTKHVTVQNCYFHHAGGGSGYPFYSNSALTLSNVQNGRIVSNYFNNSANGIFVGYDGCANIVLDANTCCYNTNGIYCAYSDGTAIRNSDCRENVNGIHTYMSDANELKNNNCSYNSEQGVKINDGIGNILEGSKCHGNGNNGIMVTGCRGGRIANSTISGNTDEAGIAMYSTEACNVKLNNLTTNLFGIVLFHSSGTNDFTYNDLYRNQGYGVFITAGNNNNDIHHNNFMQNNGATRAGKQAFDDGNGNEWTDGAGDGNHWSDHTGPDSNGDGVVDFAYDIAGISGSQDGNPHVNSIIALSLDVWLQTTMSDFTGGTTDNMDIEDIGDGALVLHQGTRATRAGADIYVDGASGDDANPGTMDQPKLTITSALGAISGAGNTIHIKGGITYTENVAMGTSHSGVDGSPNIMQAWEGTGRPLITTPGDTIKLTGTDYFTLRGLEVTGTDSSYDCIETIGTAEHVTIENCIIYRPSTNYGYCINMGSGSHYGVVRNCRLYTAPRLFYITSSDYCEVYNNMMYDVGHYGFFPSSCTDLYFYHNTVYSSCSSCVYSNNANNNVFKNNIFYNPSSSTTDYCFMAWGDKATYPWTSDHNIFYCPNGAKTGNNNNFPQETLTDWQASTSEDANSLDLDPLFVDIDGADNVIGTADDNFHIQDSSPARDAGTNVGITTDFDGGPRPSDAGYEIGADELPDSGTSGTFTSETYTPGFTACWAYVIWTEDVPANTDLTIETRSGDTATPDGSWSAWSTSLSTPSGSAILSPSTEYIQYRVSMNSPDTSTPTLYEISIHYSKTPLLWDTGEEDFSAGTVNKVDASTSPGDLLLKNNPPYSASGNLISREFSPGSSPDYKRISWSALVPMDTTVRFRIRSASTQSGLGSATFYGPGGDTGAYYTLSSGQPIWSGHDGHAWIQYVVYLDTADTAVTPEVYRVAISFS